jgi:serine protease Do
VFEHPRRRAVNFTKKDAVMKSFSKMLFGVFAGMLGALALAVLFHVTSWGKDAEPDINVETTPVNRDAGSAASFAPIVKKAAPSVVNIYTTRIIHVQARRNPFANDPYFRQFFGDQTPTDGGERTRKEEILGSGVIVSPDGYILTANHVVSGEEEIKVTFGDGEKKEYTAKVIGTDPQTDIAVLKIDARYLPAITLADSDQLEVGDVVLAIGNPFEIGQTVTMGIVSALGRNGFDFGDPENRIQNFIQTDAAINPGNSGGALVDTEGRLVGINTAIKTSSDGNEGIGFAVPINMARQVMERLINGGRVTRGFLGVNMQDLDADLASAFGLADQNGVIVDDAVPNSPGANAGLLSGDVIIAFNGKTVTDANSLLLAISGSQPGSQATLKLVRNENVQTVTVTLGEKQETVVQNGNVQNAAQPSAPKAGALDGVTLADMDRAARQDLGVPNNIQGAFLASVAQDSNFADAGLQRGDIIEEVNRQPVTSAADAVKFCRLAKTKQILVKIWRRAENGGFTKWMTVDNSK